MVTTNLCFTQMFMIGHLEDDWSCFHKKAFKHYLPSDELLWSTYCSIWRPPTSLSTQKCGNFAKTMRMTSSHIQLLCFKTCLNNVNVSRWDFECYPHWSADLAQRSRLFICVETKSWCMLSSSIASAVFWVNSAQFFSGKSMSTKQHHSHFLGRNPDHSHLPIAHMPWEGI